MLLASVGTAAPPNDDPWGYKARYGYYTDRETGLLLTTWRYYDPGTGRFLTRDPLGYDGSINLYAYCTNDPVNLADPLGLYHSLGGRFDGVILGGPGVGGERPCATPGADYGGVDVPGKSGLGPLDGILGIAAASSIGSTGKVGEEILKELGGVSQKYGPTKLGRRFTDQVDPRGFGHESKFGYTPMTPKAKLQIDKDAELVKDKLLEAAKWHFFLSPITGEGGPSAPLEEYLIKKGIEIVKHY